MLDSRYFQELLEEAEIAEALLHVIKTDIRRIEAKLKEAKELLYAERRRDDIANGGMP